MGQLSANSGQSLVSTLGRKNRHHFFSDYDHLKLKDSANVARALKRYSNLLSCHFRGIVTLLTIKRLPTLDFLSGFP